MGQWTANILESPSWKSASTGELTTIPWLQLFFCSCFTHPFFWIIRASLHYIHRNVQLSWIKPLHARQDLLDSTPLNGVETELVSWSFSSHMKFSCVDNRSESSSTKVVIMSCKKISLLARSERSRCKNVYKRGSTERVLSVCILEDSHTGRIFDGVGHRCTWFINHRQVDFQDQETHEHSHL